MMDDLFAVVERGKKEWESAVDSIAEGVALYDRESMTVRRANWPLARWLDSTPQQMVGLDLLEALADCTADGFVLSVLLGQSVAGYQEVSRTSSGQTWLLSVFPIVISNQQSNNSVLVVRDITQEKQLQQGIIEAEKRGAMVRTVAGLAQQIIPSVGHIQQHLSSINANIQELRSAFVDYRIALRTGERSRSNLPTQTPWEAIETRHHVEFTLNDVEKMIRQSMQDLMRIYSSIDDLGDLQGSGSRTQYSDLHLILENSLSMIWPELGRKISIERHYLKGLPLIRCSQIRLQTALMALLVFCAQKTGSNGRILLTTTHTGDNEIQVSIQATEISDPDPGFIEPWLIESGINLDPKAGLVHNILQEHAGRLAIQIAEDSSLIATVALPISGIE